MYEDEQGYMDQFEEWEAEQAYAEALSAEAAAQAEILYDQSVDCADIVNDFLTGKINEAEAQQAIAATGDEQTLEWWVHYINDPDRSIAEDDPDWIPF